MIWSTKGRQQTETPRRPSRYGRVFMIGCDMCLKVECGIVPSCQVLEFYLDEAGWSVNKGAVVCPECIAGMKGAWL
jgi:hypothetical protein